MVANLCEGPFSPIPNSPVSKTGIERNPIIVWNSSESANSYRLQIATKSYFPLTSIVLDTTIIDTLIRIAPLASNAQYYWRVCGTMSMVQVIILRCQVLLHGDQIVCWRAEIAIAPKNSFYHRNYLTHLTQQRLFSTWSAICIECKNYCLWHAW